MNNIPNRLLYAFILFVGILAVSTASILIRFAQEEAPSLSIAAIRLAIASIALSPIALIYHRSDLFALTRRDLLLSLLSGVFLAIHFATWISSLEYTAVASSVVFVSTGPLWVALLSPIFLNEKLSRIAFYGLGLTLIGGTLIAFSGVCYWDHGLSCPFSSSLLHGRSMLGNFLALVGAWAVTGYLIIGRKLRMKISVIPYIFIVYSFAAGVLIAFMFAAGESPLGYQPKTYLWLLLLALLPQLIGHSIYNWSLRYFPATIVAVTTLGEPIGSAILAYLILKEKPGLAIFIGGSLILLGIYLASRSRKVNGEISKGDPKTVTST
jgi:drug/metabolite transporter (DMT)-like permease